MIDQYLSYTSTRLQVKDDSLRLWIDLVMRRGLVMDKPSPTALYQLEKFYYGIVYRTMSKTWIA